MLGFQFLQLYFLLCDSRFEVSKPLLFLVDNCNGRALNKTGVAEFGVRFDDLIFQARNFLR